jgi:hypothetical protein
VGVRAWTWALGRELGYGLMLGYWSMGSGIGVLGIGVLDVAVGLGVGLEQFQAILRFRQNSRAWTGLLGSSMDVGIGTWLWARL